MRLSTLVSLGVIAAGGAASLRTLAQRQGARARDNRISLVVDYDDAQAVSIRAGIPFAELLPKLKASGATHITLPERTLNRLLHRGKIFQTAPREPLPERAPLGHWNYFASADDPLVERIVSELQTRLPHIQAQSVLAACNLFAFAGDLPTIGEIGLGFDADAADDIHRAGLRGVPRPVSYDWHEPALIARTIAQAGRIDGMTPAALMLIVAYLKRRGRGGMDSSFDVMMVEAHHRQLAVTVQAGCAPPRYKVLACPIQDYLPLSPSPMRPVLVPP